MAFVCALVASSEANLRSLTLEHHVKVIPPWGGGGSLNSTLGVLLATHLHGSLWSPHWHMASTSITADINYNKKIAQLAYLFPTPELWIITACNPASGHHKAHRCIHNLSCFPGKHMWENLLITVLLLFPPICNPTKERRLVHSG